MKLLLPASLYENLWDLARARDRSLKALIVDILIEYLTINHYNELQNKTTVSTNVD